MLSAPVGIFNRETPCEPRKSRQRSSAFPLVAAHECASKESAFTRRSALALRRVTDTGGFSENKALPTVRVYLLYARVCVDVVTSLCTRLKSRLKQSDRSTAPLINPFNADGIAQRVAQFMRIHFTCASDFTIFFLVIPYTRSGVEQETNAIQCFSVIKLAFFTYYTVAMGEVNPSGPVPIDSVFIYRPDKRLELWRFAFYMFLHAGWLHLLFNLGVQVVVGLPLEMVHGSLRIAAVYMAGVLADQLKYCPSLPTIFSHLSGNFQIPSRKNDSHANVNNEIPRYIHTWTKLVIFIVGQADCSELWSGRYTDRTTRCNHKSSLGTSVFDTDVYLVGASGGVYALLAAHLANVLLNYNNMEFGIVRLIGIFVIASADVGFAIYDRYAAEQMGPPVSYVAHLTGALAGLTIGLLVLKNFEQRLHEQLLWWVALGVYAACTIFAIMYNLMHPDYP
ncbi:Protein rhomboid [Atta colombica]|uniref:Protein rhomboid n=1 Tax=Atta colombica TaxID=520822 RepID=A0A195BUC5_9HYME|nr:Protein rhomboid [Atta colombica]